MEIQTTNRNSELAKPEWLPLKSGNSEANLILQAQSTQSLRLRHEEDIKQVLRYSMLLVGLRGNNMPSEEEKFVLLNFIRSNFGNQTPEEIKLAFEWAVAGKFEIDVKCYENFSCEYFGRIMKAYIDMSRNETKTVRKEPEILSPPPTDDQIKKMAIDTINFYADKIKESKEAKKEFTWIAGGLHELYKMLVKYQIQTITKEEMLELWRKYAGIEDIEERKIQCQRHSYMILANQLADFEARIDQDGKIKPIDNEEDTK
jgi:hypothetical protein